MSMASAPGSESAALRVAFAGTPDFAAVALRAIHAAGFELPLVLTQPDRPAGRGMKLQASPSNRPRKNGVCRWLSRAVCVWMASIPRTHGLLSKPCKAAAPDVLVVAAYGLILPTWVLTLPRLGLP